MKHTSIVPVPFGLALPLLTFPKCMDVALVLLHIQGIDVLNYLGDWLILPSSKAMAASHRNAVLAYMKSLGPEKCLLSLSQRTTF